MERSLKKAAFYRAWLRIANGTSLPFSMALDVFLEHSIPTQEFPCRIHGNLEFQSSNPKKLKLHGKSCYCIDSNAR